MDNKKQTKNEIEVKKQQISDDIRKEIKDNYKIGIEYYKDIEEHED